MTNTATATRAVRVIPATIDLNNNSILELKAKRKTAAYARVSTDDEEQKNSYERQVKVYTEQIQENEQWEFAGIYADRDRSGTTMKRRDEFNRMIKDAMAGKIDFIITKSVSRFARNTVDTLTTVRQLKEKGVEVYFEKENIYTMDSKGELLITIMSSLAQEESRSISENVTWGQRKRFADGKVSMPYKRFLGYEKGEDGQPQIVESEATVVRMICALYLQGKTSRFIAEYLTDHSIPTPSKKLVPWESSTVMSILRNEKYAGNALLQKKYTVDFLTKKQKVNEGEVPQYFVENSHPAIISVETHELIQAEIKRRSAREGRHSGQYCFSGKVVCGECSGSYGSKVWHSNSKYRRVIWQCNSKFKNKKKCETPHLTDDDLKRLFVDAFNRLYTDWAGLAEDYEEIIAVLSDTSALDKKAAALAEECEVVTELIRKSIDENAHAKQDQKKYAKRHEGMVTRYETARGKLDGINDEKQDRIAKHVSMEQFVADLTACDAPLESFDEPLWYATVDTVTVSGTIAAFTFKDGTVIEIEL